MTGGVLILFGELLSTLTLGCIKDKKSRTMNYLGVKEYSPMSEYITVYQKMCFKISVYVTEIEQCDDRLHASSYRDCALPHCTDSSAHQSASQALSISFYGLVVGYH